jgi:hypothetical protein
MKTISDIITAAEQEGADLAATISDLKALPVSGTPVELVSLVAHFSDGTAVTFAVPAPTPATPVVGDVCTTADGVAGTMHDDGTGILACVAN